MLRRSTWTLLAGLAVIPSCATSDDEAGDAEDGQYDTATGKADGFAEGSVEAVRILELANDVRMIIGEFDNDVGLSRRVADAIWSHRLGPDGEEGTADDDPFDTLAELDAIPYLGPVAMQSMNTYARTHVVPTKLRIDLVAREWNDTTDEWVNVPLESLNAQLAGTGITFAKQLTLGSRQGIEFLRVQQDIAKAADKLNRELELDFDWDPSEYTGLCYDGPIERVPDAVDGLRYSLFSIYMGIQAERYGTKKTFHYNGAGEGDSETAWIRAQREQDNGDQIAVWTGFKTSSTDYLMMTDGGQQGDGTEFFAVTIKRCN